MLQTKQKQLKKASNERGTDKNRCELSQTDCQDVKPLNLLINEIEKSFSIDFEQCLSAMSNLIY